MIWRLRQDEPQFRNPIKGLSEGVPDAADLIPGRRNLGKHAVAGYARYLGISAADFVGSMASPPSSSDVAAAAIGLLADPDAAMGKAFIVSGKGLEAVP